MTDRGDSMNRTGVCDGDLAATHRRVTAKSGRVAVIRFGGEGTLKRLIRINDPHVELPAESHNCAHQGMGLDLGNTLKRLRKDVEPISQLFGKAKGDA